MENMTKDQRLDIINRILVQLNPPLTFEFLELIDFYDGELKGVPEWEQQLIYMREYKKMFGYKEK